MATEEKQGGSRKKLIIISVTVVVVVIATLVGVIIYLLSQQEDEVVNGRAVLVTKDNVDEVTSEDVEEGYYLVTMNNNWEFDDGKAESTNAYVANAKENTKTVYFDVTLSDTGELIYSSPYMPVGSELEGFALDKDLDAGEYTAIVTYYMVDEEYEVVDDVSTEVIINVMN